MTLLLNEAIRMKSFLSRNSTHFTEDKSDLISCINVPHRNKSSNSANLRIINHKLDVGIFVTSSI